MSTTPPPSRGDRTVRWGLNDATVGIALAVALAWTVSWAATRGWAALPELRVALSFLATAVPLLGAVLFASYVRGRHSLVRDFGLRFAWIDLFFGLVVGGMMRAATTLVEILLYGRVASGGPTFGAVDNGIWWLLFVILAPVLAAPFIEELFFRGLLQRALVRASRGSAPPAGTASRIPVVMAIGVTALIFAAVQMLQIDGGLEMIVVGISTLILGIGTGVLAATTGRLGAAIIAHVTYNGLVVAWSLL